MASEKEKISSLFLSLSELLTDLYSLRLKILATGIALFYSLDEIAAIVTNHLGRKIKNAFPAHFFAPPFRSISPQTNQIQTTCQVIILEVSLQNDNVIVIGKMKMSYPC
jgi:hypothetical protein